MPLKLTDNDFFTSMDVASFCNMEHQEVRRRITKLMSTGLMTERDYISVRPVTGVKKCYSFKLTVNEFIFLTFRCWTGSLAQFEIFMNNILAEKEISKLMMLHSSSVSEFVSSLDSSVGGGSVGGVAEVAAVSESVKVSDDLMSELFK